MKKHTYVYLTFLCTSTKIKYDSDLDVGMYQWLTFFCTYRIIKSDSDDSVVHVPVSDILIPPTMLDVIANVLK